MDEDEQQNEPNRVVGSTDRKRPRPEDADDDEYTMELYFSKLQSNVDIKKVGREELEKLFRCQNKEIATILKEKSEKETELTIAKAQLGKVTKQLNALRGSIKKLASHVEKARNEHSQQGQFLTRIKRDLDEQKGTCLAVSTEG